MAHNLDYTALIRPITQADIDAYKKRGGKSEAAYLELGSLGNIIVFAALLIISFPLMLALIFLAEGHAIGLIPGAVALLFIIAFVRFLIPKVRRPIEMKAKLYSFVAQNNLQLFNDIKDPNYLGAIFNKGHRRVITTALQFSDGIEMGNYSYTTGHGRNQEIHYWSYAKTKLTRRLPHIVLDAKSNNSWNLVGLSESLDRSQTLALEGDFNNYFTLYAPKQYERDVLYVLTPDVMMAMVKHGQNYDIEIVDDELFIYNHGHFPIDKPHFYHDTLAIIDKISSELIQQTDYYVDERIGNRTANVIAPHGQRLKQKFNWLAITAATIAGVFFILFWSTRQDMLLSGTMMLIVLVAVRFIRR